MPDQTVVISINASWNIVNFRASLVRALQNAGYRVVGIAPSDDWSPALASLGIDHIPIAMDKSGASPTRDFRLYRDYRRILREVRPAAFLGFTAKPNIYGSLAAQGLGIPVINNISGLGTAFIKRSWLTPIVSNLYRLSLRRSHRVFFQNPDDRALFVAKRLVREANTALLPGSGIDLTAFAPSPAIGGDGTVFLLVARLLWDKGVGEFIKAARIVKRERPGARFQLLGFVGAENRTAVTQAQVDAWVAEGLVEYRGTTNDVRPFLASADCVVLPSYREGLPRSLLEAAAMAKPLIATDVAGCREIVRDGLNGFLCPPRDGEGLADAMRRFLALSPAGRAELGQAGRRLAEAHYDEAIVHRAYLDALASAPAVRR